MISECPICGTKLVKKDEQVDFTVLINYVQQDMLRVLFTLFQKEQ